MIVYLAHPIDQGALGPVVAPATRALALAGHVVFDPARAWLVPPGAEPSPGLQAANLAALRKCDAVVAMLDPDRLSIGVVTELVEAAHTGIPAIVVGDLNPSWALAHLAVPQVPTIEAAIEWLNTNKEQR